jgi:hypothetical protein
MASEVSRTDYGMTDKGAVTLIVFNNTDDVGDDHFVYQVRHGVRTVAEFTSKTKGEALARSLTA